MGPAEVVTMSCHANSDMALQKLRLPRSDGQDDCPPAPMPPVTPYRKLPQSYTQGGEQVMLTLLLLNTCVNLTSAVACLYLNILNG